MLHQVRSNYEKHPPDHRDLTPPLSSRNGKYPIRVILLPERQRFHVEPFPEPDDLDDRRTDRVGKQLDELHVQSPSPGHNTARPMAGRKQHPAIRLLFLLQED